MACADRRQHLWALGGFLAVGLVALWLLLPAAPRPEKSPPAGFCLTGQAGEQVRAAFERVTKDRDEGFAGVLVTEGGAFLRVAQPVGEGLLRGEAHLPQAATQPVGLVFAWHSGQNVAPELVRALNRETTRLGEEIWRACRPAPPPDARPALPSFRETWASNPTSLAWARAAFLLHLALLVLLVRRR